MATLSDNIQQVKNEEKILNLNVHESGLCIGIIQWIKVKFFKDNSYENKPGEITSHWPTPVYLFDKPVEVIAGQILKIHAKLFEDSVWFYHLE